jgi:hypothetical protein
LSPFAPREPGAPFSPVLPRGADSIQPSPEHWPGSARGARHGSTAFVFGLPRVPVIGESCGPCSIRRCQSSRMLAHSMRHGSCHCPLREVRDLRGRQLCRGRDARARASRPRARLRSLPREGRPQMRGFVDLATVTLGDGHGVRVANSRAIQVSRRVCSKSHNCGSYFDLLFYCFGGSSFSG